MKNNLCQRPGLHQMAGEGPREQLTSGGKLKDKNYSAFQRVEGGVFSDCRLVGYG